MAVTKKKPKPKSTPKSKTPKKPKQATGDEKLLVRMYNVGFGDCFLIVIPGDPKRTILVDAGFHSQGRGHFSAKELTRQVLDDLEQLTGKKRADVVIGTHRHQDHITCFNDKQWGELEVGEVWLPWVDDPDNQAAKKLWKKKTGFALALTESLPSLAIDDSSVRKGIAFALWNAGVEYERLSKFAGWPLVESAAMGVVSNANALTVLRSGFAQRDVEKPRYLPETDEFPEVFQTPVLPGVRVHVLGPPRDPDLLEEGNPVTDGESYKAFALQQVNDDHQAAAPPFAARFILDDEASKPPASVTKRLDDTVRRIDPMLAAAALDGIINATSLVLVLQIGRARLLLPGDAEWGTWKQILDDPKAVTLLEGTKFLKVGHHGSHNATPKTLVDKVLPDDTLAMISTQEGKEKYRNNIPLAKLLEALAQRGIIHCRSDRPEDAEAEHFAVDGERWIDVELEI